MKNPGAGGSIIIIFVIENLNTRKFDHWKKKSHRGGTTETMPPPSATRLGVEALVVGLVFVTLFSTVHAADMAYRGRGAMSHGSLALHAFLAGVIGHIAFELTGVNRRYVDLYHNG